MNNPLKVTKLVVAGILALTVSLASTETFAQPTESEVDALIEAAGTGDLKTVKASIEGGIPVDAKDSLGVTALMEASYGGKLPVVKFLLEIGADANAKDQAGTSPLLEALGQGHADVAMALIDAGADPNQLDGEGRNILHRAVQLSRLDLLRIALKAGADIESSVPKLTDKDGQDLGRNITPLGCAILLDDIAATRFLIDAGANLQPSGLYKSWTLLNYARRHGNKKMIDLLLAAGVKPNADLLAHAARNDLTLLRRLLKDPSLQGWETLGWALYVAIGVQNAKSVDELLKSGADPNRDSPNDFMHGFGMPLMVAAEAGDLKIVKRLVKAGAGVNRGGSWKIPIASAALAGRYDIVEFLAESGADLEKGMRQFAGSSGGPEWADRVNVFVKLGASVDGVIMTAASADNFAAVKAWLPRVTDWGELEGRTFTVSRVYETLLRAADAASECQLKEDIDRMFKRKTGYKPPDFIVYSPKCGFTGW